MPGASDISLGIRVAVHGSLVNNRDRLDHARSAESPEKKEKLLEQICAASEHNVDPLNC